MKRKSLLMQMTWLLLCLLSQLSRDYFLFLMLLRDILEWKWFKENKGHADWADKGSSEKPLHLDWVTRVKNLGIHVSSRKEEVTAQKFEERLNQIQQTIKIWSKGGLSLFGKVTTLKRFFKKKKKKKKADICIVRYSNTSWYIYGIWKGWLSDFVEGSRLNYNEFSNKCVRILRFQFNWHWNPNLGSLAF